jgi:DNA-binding NarL/FixJ family response regulator
MPGPGPRSVRILILADDLIWSSRLAGFVRAAGAEPRVVATLAAHDAALDEADRVIVDLTARTYDGLEAVERAARSGREVICVGQHDDHELRRRARAAGATRVYAYRGLVEGGPATIAGWLDRPGIAETVTTDERTTAAR